MGVSHDAYLFNPDKFIEIVKPFLRKFDNNEEGYQLLRSKALEVIENHQHVKYLSDQYGSWDKKSLETQIPSDKPEDIEDVFLWFGLLLYSSIEVPEQIDLGLRINYGSLGAILNLVGWNEKEKDLHVHGHSFADLLPSFSSLGITLQIKGNNIESFWKKFEPISTCGSFGWMGYEDAEFLLSKFIHDEEKILGFINEKLDEIELDYGYLRMAINDLRKRNGHIDNNRAISLVDKARTMLTEAVSNNLGLLYVISG